jgi:hypothetical protein
MHGIRLPSFSAVRKIVDIGIQGDSVLAEYSVVDLNEPVTIGNKMVFCRVGNSLAIRFLAASRDAVILAGAAAPQDVAWRVEEALAEMLVHRAKCRECDPS